MNSNVFPSDDPAANPGHLIAALPALLGQSPTEAAVLLLTHGGLITGRRIEPLTHSAHVLFARLLNATAHVPADSAYLIAISEKLTAPTSAVDLAHLPAPFQALPGAVADQLGNRGIAAAGLWGTTAVAAAAPWWTLTGLPRTGSVSDPAAIAATMAGHRDTDPHSQRAEAAALFARDPQLTTTISEHLPAAEAAAADRLAAAIRRNTPDQHFHAELTRVTTYIAEFTTATEADPARIAELAVILRCPRVRTDLAEQASREHPQGTDQAADLAVLALLISCTQGNDQANAATLLGLAMYTRTANTAAALVAVETALRADPHHRFAPILHEAITQGTHPADIRAAVLRTPHPAPGGEPRHRLH